MNKTVWTHIGRGLLIVAAIGIFCSTCCCAGYWDGY